MSPSTDRLRIGLPRFMRISGLTAAWALRRDILEGSEERSLHTRQEKRACVSNNTHREVGGRRAENQKSLTCEFRFSFEGENRGDGNRGRNE
jgi:hypothetical protein